MKRNKTSIWNGLNRNKQPNKISPRKVAKLNAEVPERLALIKRCGGKAGITKRTIKFTNGKTAELTTVTCYGGRCECGCKELATGAELHPHEAVLRSRGGVVSISNSIMVKNRHHPDYRKVKLEWIK